MSQLLIGHDNIISRVAQYFSLETQKQSIAGRAKIVVLETYEMMKERGLGHLSKNDVKMYFRAHIQQQVFDLMRIQNPDVTEQSLEYMWRTFRESYTSVSKKQIMLSAPRKVTTTVNTHVTIVSCQCRLAVFRMTLLCRYLPGRAIGAHLFLSRLWDRLRLKGQRQTRTCIVAYAYYIHDNDICLVDR